MLVAGADPVLPGIPFGDARPGPLRARRKDCVRRGSMIDIQVKRLPHGEGLPLPTYATEHAAGLDVVAAEELTLAPGARHAVATGFAIAIPHGYEVQVRPRSGLALKHGITCLNTPGTIDRSEEPRVRNECVSTCTTRLSADS